MSLAFSLTKIVSGGQTGVDRAALDVAIHLEIPHGGWCPKGRRSEAGEIPREYKLRETKERDYSIRTTKNVVESDGTLILYRDQLSGGTELTYRLVQKHRRPHLCINLAKDEAAENEIAQSVVDWVIANNVRVLNVAGPRESGSPGITKMAESFLFDVLRRIAAPDSQEQI